MGDCCGGGGGAGCGYVFGACVGGGGGEEEREEDWLAHCGERWFLSARESFGSALWLVWV